MAVIQYPETPSFTKSTSKTVTVKGTHRLEIQGYSLIKGMGVGKCVSSNTFSVGGHLWQIQFYPDGFRRVDESGQVYVSLCIKLISKCEEEVRACFEYVLLDQSGIKLHKGQKNFTIKEDSTLWGIQHFHKRTELEALQFIKEDCLTIQCTVGVMKTSMDIPKAFSVPISLSDLGQIYEQLLESKEGSDVSFEVEGETFYAHKLILSTRSPVFKAQFFGALKEENTRCIKIEEMQTLVFKALLRFIYCDVIPDFDSKCATTIMSQNLLAAADRYGIERLRSLCELRLCENITINNVASTLVLAEQHACFQLKSTCLEFLGLPKNLEAVMRTDGFKNLKENYPAVIDELLKSIVGLRDFSMVSNEPGIKELERESFSCYRGAAHICGLAKRLLFGFLWTK